MHNLGSKRTAPLRPREQPPSLPRSPDRNSELRMHTDRDSHSPPSLGSMSSLHDILKVNI